MTNSVADHWAKGDVYSRVMEAMKAASISPETVTIEQLAPVDHFHVRGFPATIELVDVLPIKAGDHLVDIGCGIGGPARYLVERFKYRVSGIDITEPFVDAANKITKLLKMGETVEVQLGDGQQLPYPNQSFDGGYLPFRKLDPGPDKLNPLRFAMVSHLLLSRVTSLR